MPAKLPLLLVGIATLLLSGGSLLILTRMQANESTTARIKTVLDPYRAARDSQRPKRRSLRERMPTAGPRIAAVFRIDLDRSESYPVHWGWVLIGTLLAARASTLLVGMIVAFPEWLPVPFAWVAFSRIVLNGFAARRRDKLYRQFPDALGMMGRSLRVGQTVTQALREVARDARAPTNTEFNRLADRLAIGVPLSEAISEMATQSGLTEYRFFATTLLLQYQTGGSLTEALDGLAEVIRGRVMLRRRGHALAAEARTSAIVLGVLPIFTGLALAFLAPAYFSLLFDDPIGRRVLAAAICMLVMGAAVMHVMTSRVLK